MSEDCFVFISEKQSEIIWKNKQTGSEEEYSEGLPSLLQDTRGFG